MKKKRRFGRRVFCVLIVLFMGVIWQSDLLSQEPAEVRSLRKQEILQTDDNYREYYFGLLTEDEKKIYREMLSGIQERQDEFYLTSSNERLISKVCPALWIRLFPHAYCMPHNSYLLLYTVPFYYSLQSL